MKLEYEATIENIAEPQVRLYLKSESCKRQRILSLTHGVLLYGAIVFLVFFIVARDYAQLVTILIVLLVAGITWFCHEDLVRRRIVEHVRREMKKKGLEKQNTIYIIDSERIRCESLGAEVSFSLSDYSGMSECRDYFEFGFGSMGLCLVPKKAFESGEIKNKFMKAIQENRVGRIITDPASHNTARTEP